MRYLCYEAIRGELRRSFRGAGRDEVRGVNLGSGVSPAACLARERRDTRGFGASHPREEGLGLWGLG